MDVVKEIAAKLCVDVKSLLMSCLPHILVHILPLSAADAADQQARLTKVGFECYNMLIAELGKQVRTVTTTDDAFCLLVIYILGWWSGVVVTTLASIDEVNLCRAQLVLRWATMSGFISRCWTFILVCNLPATQGQLSLLSLWGR